MRIIIMETGDFGVPAVEALLRSNHEILGLITRPVRYNRGGNPLPDPKVALLAEEFGVPIYRFPKIKAPEAVETIRALEADIFFICDYGQILSPDGIKSTRLGGVNLHGSLLPRYRGAAPVQWAVYNGDKVSGISVLHVTPEVDAGPVMETLELPIDDAWTAADLEYELSKIGVQPVLNAIRALELDENQIHKSVPQNPLDASGAPKLRKEMSFVDWNRSAVEIRNQVRAFEPWPRTRTTWRRSEKKPPLELILLPIPQAIDAASAGYSLPEGTRPGTVLRADSVVDVATGSGILRISDLQPANKKPMSAAEFLRGYPLTLGTILGDSDPPTNK
ncbi:MAG: methionyl-tRNA formyltransferase [Planctomycetia bacterium]|nr:methionyl-tRNA formyltransferase [Planctomycetia bacterium]